jgi:hypothetical protein
LTQEVLFSQGPYLAAAFLCETLLQEGDGKNSPIRILDRITHSVMGSEPPEKMEPFKYQITLYVSFKAGSARGPMMLEVRLQKPSGESPSPFAQELNFEGDDERGVNVVGQLQMEFETAGLYWFDVYLGGHRVTRIPFRVIYSRAVRQTNAPS